MLQVAKVSSLVLLLVICSGSSCQSRRLKFLPENLSLSLLKEKLLDKSERIVYGNVASEGQFPYFGYAVLHYQASMNFCGSTLISQLWVLTAAHCMEEVLAAQVFFGSVDKLNMPTSRSASEFIVHESYNQPTPLANDIALIKLSSPIIFNHSVRPVRLPKASDQTFSFSRVLLVAMGFGRTENGIPRYLQFTYLRGLSNSYCRKVHWVYLDTMLCAKSSSIYGNGICFGDSGGPLVTTMGNSDEETLIGISSYVETQKCVNEVQGFTRVDHFLDWINFHTGIETLP
jgi:secreted trypsin-like serine protease